MSTARSTGLEPATSPVTGERSNQLNYERIDLQCNRFIGLEQIILTVYNCVDEWNRTIV